MRYEFPMDATERIQKINAMSQELKKFGFFEDSHDAVEGATNIYLSEDEQKESQIFSSEDNVLHELSNSFHRFKNATHNRMDEMSKTILTLNSQIKTLVESISTLQTRHEVRPQTVPSPEIRKQEEVRPTIPKPQSKDANTSQEGSENPYNERQGHFTSDDVKIENIFYYGKK